MFNKNFLINLKHCFNKTLSLFSLYWPIFLLLLFASLFYFSYINLTTSDLGRHIINGREIVSEFTKAAQLGNFNSLRPILTTNYYSFTQNNFEFTNHHWFFGVMIFGLHSLFGFSGLTIINVFLNVGAIGLILFKTLKFDLDKNGKNLKTDLTLNKKGSVWLAVLIGFFVLPLFTHRTEVRPESFSLFFFAVYFFVFDKLNTKNFQKLSSKSKVLKLIPIFLVQIIWVNTHLFFIFGPLIAGYYAFENFLSWSFSKLFKNKNEIKNNYLRKFKFWIYLSIGLFTISLINPNGVTGLFAPFQIFNNYAYRVAENQSSLFMISYGSQVNYYRFVIGVSSFAFLSFISQFTSLNKYWHNFGKIFSKIILLTIFIFLGNKINRMSPFLAIISLPILITNFSELLNKIKPKTDKIISNNFTLMFVSSLSFALLILVLKTKIFLPKTDIIGYGLIPKVQNSTDFFTKNNLSGPVFNNYDIGGFFIYNFFPKEKAFIDNRPEAYSAEFLKDEYLASLTNEKVWQDISKKYSLNTIFFYRHDQIEGGQEFLFKRVNDEAWIPVYVDNFVIIFVKNVEKNKKIIENYQIPNEVFKVSKM